MRKRPTSGDEAPETRPRADTLHGTCLPDARRTSWLKIENPTYTQAVDRHELFAPGGGPRQRSLPRTPEFALLYYGVSSRRAPTIKGMPQNTLNGLIETGSSVAGPVRTVEKTHRGTETACPL
jgi:hypothetical protein